MIRFINFLFFAVGGFALTVVAQMFALEAEAIWRCLGFTTLITALCLYGLAVYEIIRDEF